jgi:hypothetical protein
VNEGAVIKLDQQIDHAQRTARIHADRLPLLKAKLHEERRREVEKQKAAALKTFEARMADEIAAGRHLDRAVAAFSAALRAYETASKATASAWNGALFPRHLGHGVPSNLFQRLANELRIPGGASTAHTLLTELPQRLGSVADSDVSYSNSLIADIREAPLPELREDVEEAA